MPSFQRALREETPRRKNAIFRLRFEPSSIPPSPTARGPTTARQRIFLEIVMTQRVVSKQTKLLFIGFGAASIAMVCIVAAAEMSAEDAANAWPAPIAHKAVSARPAK